MIWWKKVTICATQSLSPNASLSPMWVQHSSMTDEPLSDSTRHLMGTYDISLKSDRGCCKVLVRSKVSLQGWKHCALSCLGSTIGFLFLSALEFITTTCRPSFNKRSGSLESRYFGFFLFQWQFLKKWRKFLKSTEYLDIWPGHSATDNGFCMCTWRGGLKHFLCEKSQVNQFYQVSYIKVDQLLS